MSEKDIVRWHKTITPQDKAPQPWTIGSGGSWDMLEVQPIPDEMLAELAKLYSHSGTPWNCRSLPLSPSDREYMFLLYFSMQGLVARMRQAEQAYQTEHAARLAAQQELADRTKDAARLAFILEHPDQWFAVWSDPETMRDAIDMALTAYQAQGNEHADQ